MSVTDQDWGYYSGDPGDIIEAQDTDLRSWLARIIGPLPAWRREALCRDFDLALWFPTQGQPNQPALDICGHCPVRAECLDEALADSSLDYGVRGGATAQARKLMRKTRKVNP